MPESEAVALWLLIEMCIRYHIECLSSSSSFGCFEGFEVSVFGSVHLVFEHFESVEMTNIFALSHFQSSAHNSLHCKLIQGPIGIHVGPGVDGESGFDLFQ